MTDLSEAAADKLNPPQGDAVKKRIGRPPGSKNKTKPTGAGAAVDSPEDEAAPFVYVRDETSVMASMAMGMTVWFLASKMLPVRELTEEEGMQLGEALDPVLCKWIPILGAWKYEANLLVCIVMLYMATKVDKTVTKEAPSEEVDATRSATG